MVIKVYQLEKATKIFDQFSKEGFVMDMWNYNEFLYWCFLGMEEHKEVK